MVTTTSLKVGESLTIGLYFNDNYQLPTTCNLIAYIGGVCVGNLFSQDPQIEEVSIYYTMKLSSQDTSKMRGYRDLIVVLDDPLGFGNKKTIVGGILFDRLADEFISTSENQGYNLLIGMTVNEDVVTGDIELLNAIKGNNGDDGKDGLIQSVVAGTNITVDNTDPANPIVSSVGLSPIETISVNGTELPIAEKNVDITVPTQPLDIGAEPANENIQSHIGIVAGNPHGTTASDVGASPISHDHAGQVINPEGIKLDTVNTLVVANAGEIGWNATDGTVNLQLLNNTKLQIGQELHIYGKASEAINNRDVIQFAGVQGDHILIKKAVQSEIAVNPTLIMGIATQNIASNNFGYVTWFGKINDVFTTGFSLSDMLYFDSSGVVAGAITNVAPTAPNRKILLATVIKLQTGASENGIIMVRPTFGTKLADLDDVNGTDPTTGSILVYNQTLGVHDFTSKVSDFSQTGHTHDDRYYTESEITTLLSSKSDTSHLHTGIYSSLSMNVLTAGAGATEYTLLRNIQTNILNTLPSGVNSTITLPVSVAGELNESALHFSTGAVVPTLVYNGFTPVWLGGTSLTLKINKTYTIVFEQVRTATGVWTVKTSWGEY